MMSGSSVMSTEEYAEAISGTFGIFSTRSVTSDGRRMALRANET